MRATAIYRPSRLRIRAAALTAAGESVMRIGDVTMAILLLIGIYGPLNMLGFNYREIRQAFIDMEQMVELKARKPDIVDAPGAQDLPPATGRGAEIVFEDVGD